MLHGESQFSGKMTIFGGPSRNFESIFLRSVKAGMSNMGYFCRLRASVLVLQELEDTEDCRFFLIRWCDAQASGWYQIVVPAPGDLGTFRRPRQGINKPDRSWWGLMLVDLHDPYSLADDIDSRHRVFR